MTTVHSKNITLLLPLFLINNNSANTVGQVQELRMTDAVT